MLAGMDSWPMPAQGATANGSRPRVGIPSRFESSTHEQFGNIYDGISQPYSQVYGVQARVEPSLQRAMEPDSRHARSPTSRLAAVVNHTNELVLYLQANMSPSEMMLRGQGLLPDKPHPATKGEVQVKVPDEENCALFLKYIPTSVTHGKSFRIINCGAVYMLHIYPAVDGHTTLAAKLVFMKASSTATFLPNHMKQPVVLHGRRISVEYNRDGARRHTGKQTRVLRVKGPEEGRTFAFWNQYIRQFSSCFFELVYSPSTVPGESVVDLRFARVEGQSQMVMKSIRQDPALQHLRVNYGPDPCDPSSIPAFVFTGNNNNP